jgi:hypothetical protein
MKEEKEERKEENKWKQENSKTEKGKKKKVDVVSCSAHFCSSLEVSKKSSY